jgi:hypothetical protein
MYVSALARPFLTTLGLLALASRAPTAEPPPALSPPAVSNVSGEVHAAGSDQPLAGARVLCGANEVAAGPDGRFVITLPPGEWTCEVSAERHFPQRVPVSVSEGAPVTLQFSLAPDMHVRESVEVTAPALDAGATTVLAPADVVSAAGAAENIFRVLETMPGVVGANEYQSRLAVRGGGPDQNLTVMDGVEIHSPYRLDGVMSAFNPETVTDFELTTGAFSARYGDRLSSILVVRNRAGGSGPRRGGSAALGMTDGNVTVDGPLPAKLPGTWVVAARQTYYDVIAERVVRTNLPGFRDLQARSTLELPGGRRLTLFALTGHEWADTVVPPKDLLPRRPPASTGGGPPASSPRGSSVVQKSPRRIDTADPPDEPVDPIESPSAPASAGTASATVPVAKKDPLGNLDRFVLDSHNGVFAATFESPLGARLRSTTTVSSYVNDEDQTLVRRRAISPLAADRGVGIRDTALRSELALDLGRHALDAGFEAHALRTRWDWRVGGLRADDTWSWGAPGGPTTWGRGLPTELQSRWTSSRGGAWVEDRMRVGGRGLVRAGLRIDRANVNGETTVSPRLLATWRLAAGRVYVGAGRHFQSPGYEKLVQGDYFFDLSGAVRYAEALPTASQTGAPVIDPSAPASSAPSSPLTQVVATGAQALRSARSLQLVAGIEQRVFGVANVRVEAYHKTFDRLTVGRLETEEERRARVAKYDFPAELAGSIPQAAEVTRFPVSDGRGSAYGVEVVVSRVARGARRTLDGWISYSYGVAEREAWGRRFAFDYDRRHAVTLVASWQARKWLRLGLTGRVASGFPRTPEIRRVSAIEDASDTDGDGNRNELIPRRDGNGALIYETVDANLAQINSERYPYYARLDARVTFTPRGRDGRLMLYLDVINVLNRRIAIVQVIPILPSLGARWRF